ncbi:MAG: RNA polymerase sigma factor [Planctomycetota bacterium]
MLQMHPPFQEISSQFTVAVYRYFTNRLSDTTLAEDLTQDTFVKALRNYPPQQSESVRNWLFAIASNVFRDHLRHKQVVRRFEEDAARELSAAEKSESRRAVAPRHENELVRECLDQMDSESREVLVLKEIDGFTVEEIMVQLGLSRDRVRYRLAKAREHFTHLFQRGTS